MYRFTDTNESPLSDPASLETVFNGIVLDRELSDLAGSFQTLSVQGRGIMSYSADIFNTGDTAVLGNRRLEPRVLVLNYRLRDATSEGLRRRFERLNAILSVPEKELIFTDDASLRYTATFTTAEDPEENSNDIVASLSFICPDPKKYGKPIKLKNVEEVRMHSIYPVHPVIEIELDSAQTEFVVRNLTRGLYIHLKSETPFTAADPIIIDAKLWTIRQGATDRIRDLIITSDLEDFVVSAGDQIELTVPGSLSLTVEGAFL